MVVAVVCLYAAPAAPTNSVADAQLSTVQTADEPNPPAVSECSEFETGGCDALYHVRKALEQSMYEYTAKYNVSYGLGIATKHGAVTVNAGVNDIWATPKKTMPTNTRIPVGSVTKPFTSVALMKLVEQGKISLDEKAHVRLDYILQNFRPEWKNKGTFQEVWGNNPQVNEITVRQIAEMKSGLRDYDNTQVFDRYLNKPSETIFISEYIDMTPKNLLGAPGTYGPFYSSTGYGLLGLIVANASGIAPKDYLSYNQLDIIFGKKSERQGVAKTAFRDTEFFRTKRCSDQNFPVAHQFYKISLPSSITGSSKETVLEQDLYDYTCSGGYGFGSMASTGREIASFFYMLLSGKETILKNSTLNEMMNFEPMKNSWATSYNYGMGLFWNRNGFMQGATGAGGYGNGESTAPRPSIRPKDWVQFPETPSNQIWTVNHGGATWASGAGPAGYDPEADMSFVVIYTSSGAMSTSVSQADAAVYGSNQICTQLSVARVALGYSALQCYAPSVALAEQAPVSAQKDLQWAQKPETKGYYPYSPCKSCGPCAPCFSNGVLNTAIPQCNQCTQCGQCYGQH
jgi:D-alanyl-D-alanine carboxypeptidase